MPWRPLIREGLYFLVFGTGGKPPSKIHLFFCTCSLWAGGMTPRFRVHRRICLRPPAGVLRPSRRTASYQAAWQVLFVEGTYTRGNALRTESRVQMRWADRAPVRHEQTVLAFESVRRNLWSRFWGRVNKPEETGLAHHVIITRIFHPRFLG